MAGLLSSWGTHQVAVAITLVLFVALSGCNAVDESDLDSVLNGDDSPLPDASNGGSNQIQDISDIISTKESVSNEVDSFTINITTRMANTDGTVIKNKTTRVDSGGSQMYADTYRRVRGPTENTTRTEYFSSGNVTFVRHTVPGVNASSYERLQSVELVDFSRLQKFDAHFDFNHERVEDGKHRFTVNSVDQIVGETPNDGEIEKIKMEVVIDENGLLRYLLYDMTVNTANGKVRYHTEWEVSNIGRTSVKPPDWLEEARKEPVR